MLLLSPSGLFFEKIINDRFIDSHCEVVGKYFSMKHSRSKRWKTVKTVVERSFKHWYPTCQTLQNMIKRWQIVYWSHNYAHLPNK